MCWLLAGGKELKVTADMPSGAASGPSASQDGSTAPSAAASGSYSCGSSSIGRSSGSVLRAHAVPSIRASMPAPHVHAQGAGTDAVKLHVSESRPADADALLHVKRRVIVRNKWPEPVVVCGVQCLPSYKHCMRLGDGGLCIDRPDPWVKGSTSAGVMVHCYVPPSDKDTYDSALAPHAQSIRVLHAAPDSAAGPMGFSAAADTARPMGPVGNGVKHVAKQELHAYEEAFPPLGASAGRGKGTLTSSTVAPLKAAGAAGAAPASKRAAGVGPAAAAAAAAAFNPAAPAADTPNGIAGGQASASSSSPNMLSMLGQDAVPQLPCEYHVDVTLDLTPANYHPSLGGGEAGLLSTWLCVVVLLRGGDALDKTMTCNTAHEVSMVEGATPRSLLPGCSGCSHIHVKGKATCQHG